MGLIGDTSKRPAVDDADMPARKRHAGVKAHIFHMLKKHSGLKKGKEKTWQGAPATCTRGKAKLALENLRKRLIACPGVQQTFVELAREHSDDASAQKGGDLGLVGFGGLPRKVAEVAFELRTDELSDTFETEDGFHVLLRTA